MSVSICCMLHKVGKDGFAVVARYPKLVDDADACIIAFIHNSYLTPIL